MNYRDWYTDIVDVYRTVDKADGNLTRKEREQVLFAVPCRLYYHYMNGSEIRMHREAAAVEGTHYLQCDNSVDIQPGDELVIYRGKGLGHDVAAIRAFAGEPQHFFEPFGAAMPGLAHQEIRLLQEERVK